MTPPTPGPLFTIGHSNHSIGMFTSLLKRHDVDILCDVRSHPYSRRNPHFNQENIHRSLHDHGMDYLFLGRELGARSNDPTCYKNGKVQFDVLAATDLFKSGLARVSAAATTKIVALMCAEHDPITCHRTLLVAHELTRNGLVVHHILANGDIETHTAAIDRLARKFSRQNHDLFMTEAQIREAACRMQAEAIAYTIDPNDIAPFRQAKHRIPS